MTAAEPGLVGFAGVGKNYDGTSFAARALDLDIRRGEFLTLLGPSGSGKTTTLVMLAGFESPAAGEILFDGRPITRAPPHRGNFGMVFQNDALFPHLDMTGNVAYPLTVRRVPRPEQDARAKRALDIVQWVGLGGRRPDQLSGASANGRRTPVFEPALLLMDEPIGARDKQLREHMQIELKDLHRRSGVTFVYVTRDQCEVLTMSDRVAVINADTLQQVDSVERLYGHPAKRFFSGFVGDAAQLADRVAAANHATGDVPLESDATVRRLNINGAAPGKSSCMPHWYAPSSLSDLG